MQKAGRTVMAVTKTRALTHLVVVDVLRGSGLPMADRKSSDPFVELIQKREAPLKPVRFKTKTKKKTLSPQWNEQFKFKYHSLDEMKAAKIKFKASHPLLPSQGLLSRLRMASRDARGCVHWPRGAWKHRPPALTMPPHTALATEQVWDYDFASSNDLMSSTSVSLAPFAAMLNHTGGVTLDLKSHIPPQPGGQLAVQFTALEI